MPRWTEESRRAQAEKIKNWQPWTKSTGAITEKGKRKSAQNSFKHGFCSKAEYDEVRFYKTLLKELNEANGLR